MARVIVGMTYQDCDKILTDSYHFRVQLLRALIQEAFTHYHDPQALYIFLAPEYFFRKNRSLSPTFSQRPNEDPYSFYTELDRNIIAANLQGLTQLRPKLLLIPGSIFWAAGSARVTSPDSWALRPVRNTVPILYKGQLLTWHHKHRDFQELTAQEQAGRHVFVGGVSHGLFLVDGLRCGIEVCGDHATSELLKARITGLDLQIIVANSVPLAAASVATATGGYVLLCSAASNRAIGATSMRVFRAARLHGTPGKFDIAKAHTGPMNAALMKLQAEAQHVRAEAQDIPPADSPTPDLRVWDLNV